jgi:hypothetical protein
MWQWSTVLPAKSTKLDWKVAESPGVSMMSVSRQNGLATGWPLTLTTLNGLTWMWNTWEWSAALVSVHSSAVPSFIWYGGRAGSKGTPSTPKLTNSPFGSRSTV